jgi:hypothetical protein
MSLSEDRRRVEGPEIIMGGGGGGMCPSDLILWKPPAWTMSSLIDLFLERLWCEFLAESSSTWRMDVDRVFLCGTDCKESS